MPDLRIGHGFDLHPLVERRDLIIGGVKIDHEKGLGGHSDADVLVHAIIDALLGASGLPDIGQQFPPSDDHFKNANSMELLQEVMTMIQDSGRRPVVNIDAVIMAEEPLLNPHIPQMKKNIASVLGIDENRVGIKATSCEGLGAIGRGEAIAASAVCLLG
ncbi:MAG: 2-C-methyl-D-erythritol 2,4-cyclodiphosphate synthase [Candidatus Zixiibacteriota bacterium]|nr:MAG: 2-C-methyl-D-erythritol 2,4-cyclodiphosphate synthase [candidate division Zixibacteria bacterium]